MDLHKFQVIAYCRDCTGVDPMGCNGGHVWQVGVFDTLIEAQIAGEEEIEDTAPWRYKIVELEMLKS